MAALAIAGSACVIFSLALAWLLVALRYLKVRLLLRIFPGDTHVLKAHIDYLLMALLLYVFYLLDAPLPGVIIAAMVLGAFTNPAFFLVMAMQPAKPIAPASLMGVLSTLSFIVTTVGFGGAAALVALQAL